LTIIKKSNEDNDVRMDISGEFISVSLDPNYKWRVIGGVGIVFIVVTGVTLTAVFSTALSAEYIRLLFGMVFGIVQNTAELIFVRHPDNRKWYWIMPWVRLFNAMLWGVFSILIYKWLGPR
jgi:hypothetical protein